MVRTLGAWGRFVVRRVAAPVAAVLAAGAAASPAIASDTDWMSLRVLNIAHQGGEDEAPSNTRYALDRAMRLGSDMLELDVHTSSDGELMVMHDATVDRTTNGSGSVYEMTRKEIQALDAGHNLVPGEGTASGRPAADYPFRGVRLGERRPPPGFRARDFRIPTLGEVMKAYPDVPTNIEIKGASDEDVASYLRNAEALAAFLNDLGRDEGIVVASFNDAALTRFHQLAPQIDLAPGTAAVAAYKAAGVPPPEGTKVFQVPIEFSGVPVTDEAFVDSVHEDGYAIHVWTINDEPTMNELLDWGVDGIMTAEPARLEKVLCETEQPRVRRPRRLPGGHCNRRSSIACDVEPTGLRRDGGKAMITLQRQDEFDSRCAGRVRFTEAGLRGRSAGFDFGWKPPSQGGPETVEAAIRLSDDAWSVLEGRGEARIRTRPYTAFASSTRVPLG
jgi:glycerophosphoryl diester phosphodiesterase